MSYKSELSNANWPYGFRISNPLYDTGIGYIEKFGMNPSVGNSIETIWWTGGLYTYLTSASTIYVTSDSLNDGTGQTGARTILVQGLNSDYEEITSIVTVGGGASTAQFLRVYRAQLYETGTLGNNAGILTISTGSGGTGTVLAKIGGNGTGVNFIGYGQTFLGLYTVPAGYNGFLTQWVVGSDTYNSPVTAFLTIRESDNQRRLLTKDVMKIAGGLHTKNYNVPLKIPEKTDIEIRAFNQAGTGVSSTFNIITERAR